MNGGVSDLTTRSHGRLKRRWVLATIGALVATIIPAVVVYACIGVVGLSTSPTSVQPGGSVTVTGKDFAPGVPVDLHLDSATGPVIFTVPAFKTDSMESTFSVTVPIPSSVSVGAHVLVATQAERDMNSGNPARAALYVGVPAAGVQAATTRPAMAIVDNGPGVGGLTLIALAATAFGLVVFAVLGVLSSRRRPEATAGA